MNPEILQALIALMQGQGRGMAGGPMGGNPLPNMSQIQSALSSAGMPQSPAVQNQPPPTFQPPPTATKASAPDAGFGQPQASPAPMPTPAPNQGFSNQPPMGGPGRGAAEPTESGGPPPGQALPPVQRSPLGALLMPQSFTNALPPGLAQSMTSAWNQNPLIGQFLNRLPGGGQ